MATAQQQYASVDCRYNNHGYHHQQFVTNMMNGQYGLNGALSNSAYNSNNNHHYSNWNQYYQYQHHHNQHQNLQQPDNNLFYNDYLRQNRFISQFNCADGNQTSFPNLENNYSNKNNIQSISNENVYNNNAVDRTVSSSVELSDRQVDGSRQSQSNINYDRPSIENAESSKELTISLPEKSTNSLKRKCDESTNDSPSLRALLTNPKLKYSPTYNLNGKKSPISLSSTSDDIINSNKDRINFESQYRQQNWNNIIYNGQYGGLPTNNSNIYHCDLTIPSPNKTEDSLDYFEYNNMRKISANKDGFEQHPSTMTSIISNNPSERSPITTPMSSYVDSISTPPLSPKDENHHINQKSNKSAMSSPDKSYVWIQNGNDCKYIIILV